MCDRGLGDQPTPQVAPPRRVGQPGVASREHGLGTRGVAAASGEHGAGQGAVMGCDRVQGWGGGEIGGDGVGARCVFDREHQRV
jgi:hypothetical protein